MTNVNSECFTGNYSRSLILFLGWALPTHLLPHPSFLPPSSSLPQPGQPGQIPPSRMTDSTGEPVSPHAPAGTEPTPQHREG